MTRGRFITFEGIDGAGKSTHHAWMVEYLRAQGCDVVSTREPGGTPLGEKLRSLLLSECMDPETEAMLMFAARREHIVRVIELALARGQWVVSDRFTDASFAYQGGGRGLSKAKLQQLETWVQGSLQPDHTFLFDLDVVTAGKRLQGTGQTADRFEREKTDFFERVRQAYLERASEFPDRFHVIDAGLSIDSIHKLLEEIISSVSK